MKPTRLNYYLIGAFLLVTSSLFAQNYKVSDYDQSANPGQVIKEIKLPPAKTTGNVYLDDDWHLGNFTMKGAPTYKGFLLRYDLQHQNLEIRIDNEIKVCVLSMLNDFDFMDKSTNQNSHFVNIDEIENSYVISHKGVVKVLLDKNIKLYQHFYLEKKEANYAPTMDIGNKDHKIIKKSSYYVLVNNYLQKVSNSLHKNEIVFGNYSNEVEQFAKANKLKLKNEQHMVAIMDFYNSLLSKEG